MAKSKDSVLRLKSCLLKSGFLFRVASFSLSFYCDGIIKRCLNRSLQTCQNRAGKFVFLIVEDFSFLF